MRVPRMAVPNSEIPDLWRRPALGVAASESGVRPGCRARSARHPANELTYLAWLRFTVGTCALSVRRVRLDDPTGWQDTAHFEVFSITGEAELVQAARVGSSGRTNPMSPGQCSPAALTGEIRPFGGKSRHGPDRSEENLRYFAGRACLQRASLGDHRRVLRGLAMPDRVRARMLPSPPTDEERLLYLHRDVMPLEFAAGFSFVSLLVSQVALIHLNPWLSLLIPVFLFTATYFGISAAVNLFTPSFDMTRHDQLVRDGRAGPWPSIDVFLPVCGEPEWILENTWRHVAQLAPHYPGRLIVHVLDDSQAPGLSTRAADHGFGYFRRENRGWFKKAGNLRHAFLQTSGDLILVLDADFAPRVDMIEELVPYFAEHPKVGIVQSPQFFRVCRTQGWLERGAGAVQELFYRFIQVSRQEHAAALCVGSCAIYRRVALDEIGGPTLINHSEDVHTGFDLRRQGWTLKYVPLPLSTGLCPPNVQSFYTQQYRWCTGSMSLLNSSKFWSTEMSIRARLSYLSGFCYYLHTALFTLVGPLVPLVMLTLLSQHIRIANYLLILPSIVYNFIVFPAWHRCVYGVEAWTTKLLSGWAHVWALWDTVRGRPMGWQPTGSVAGKERTTRFRTGLRVWTVGTGLAWVVAAGGQMLRTDPVTFLPAFALGSFYLAVGLQAVLVDPEQDTGPPFERQPMGTDPGLGAT